MLISHFAELSSDFLVSAFAYHKIGEGAFKALHHLLQENELRIAVGLFWRQVGKLYHTSVVVNLLEIDILLDDTCK